MFNKNHIVANTLTPLRDTVFVTDIDSGDKLTKSGIIILDDNMTATGVRPRWAKVHSVGPDVEDIKPGEWVLVEHGRWTNAMDFKFPDGELKIWRIEYPSAVILVSEDNPHI